MKKAKSKNIASMQSHQKPQYKKVSSGTPASHIVAYTLCALLLAFVVAKYIFGMEISFGNKPNPQSDLFNTGTTTEDSSKKWLPFGSCTADYNPVCGEDGRTYGNACIAELAKQTYIPGECPPVEADTHNISEINTELAETENDTLICTAEYNPVCADDNQVYSNSCLAKAAGAEVTGKWKCENITSEIITPTLPESEIILAKIAETENTATETKPEFSADKHHLYENARLKYGFAMPNYAYYQGYGAVNGADHTMAIALDEAGISSLENAPVQVYYFSKGTPMSNGEMIMLPNGHHVLIVTKQTDNPKIQKIAETVRASLH